MSAPVVPVDAAPVAPAEPVAAPVFAAPLPVAPVVPPNAQVAPPKPGDGLPDDAEALKAEILRLRGENAKDRTNTKAAAAKEAAEKATADLTQQLGRALGLIKDDAAPVSVEELQTQFANKETSYQSRIRELTIDKYLTSALTSAEAAPWARDAVIGSGALAGLDPDAEDFATQLQAKVTEYITKYPQLKATPAPVVPQVGASGGDFTGATPAPPGGAQSIDEIRAERAKRRAG